MAKFYGNIGFASVEETNPGVFEEIVHERKYYGDVIKNNRGYQNSGNVNDNLTISNEISIISDHYSNDNYANIRYVEYMGVKWKVTDISIQYPRLILSVGGVYNG